MLLSFDGLLYAIGLSVQLVVLMEEVISFCNTGQTNPSLHSIIYYIIIILILYITLHSIIYYIIIILILYITLYSIIYYIVIILILYITLYYII